METTFPMCDVGRIYTGWNDTSGACNRRATVHRGDHYYCRKHDPQRRIDAAHKQARHVLVLESSSDAALLAEARRRGLL